MVKKIIFVKHHLEPAVYEKVLDPRPFYVVIGPDMDIAFVCVPPIKKPACFMKIIRKFRIFLPIKSQGFGTKLGINWVCVPKFFGRFMVNYDDPSPFTNAGKFLDRRKIIWDVVQNGIYCDQIETSIWNLVKIRTIKPQSCKKVGMVLALDKV